MVLYEGDGNTSRFVAASTYTTRFVVILFGKKENI